MATAPVLTERPSKNLKLIPLAQLPSLRALLWNQNQLYISRGYSLYKTSVTGFEISCEFVARFWPPVWRVLTSQFRLSSRVFRDGFHTLAALRSGHLIAAVPGAILVRSPGETEFKISHRITRGTRPLHITLTPDDRVFWGEYFDNRARAQVNIYSSSDCGNSWNIVHTFPRGEIRHVHNIVYDPWQNCMWILTGDNGSECRIMRCSCDFSHVENVLIGSQQTRAAALVPTPRGIVFSTDTPSQQNHVYRLDRTGNLEKLADLSSSSICACAVGDSLFFSTMAEPSSINTAKEVRLYGSVDGSNWKTLLQYQKDRWPMGPFQYGNIFLPEGANNSGVLALTSCAVTGADSVTSLWTVQRE